MKIEFKPNQHFSTHSGWAYTWYFKISTKKEGFWLVSYDVISLAVGFIFSLALTLFMLTASQETVKTICSLESHSLVYTIAIWVYAIWLICSAVELYYYVDTDEFSERKTWGKLEFAIRLVVRLIRGLPIIIFGIGIITGIIYGLFYLFSLLINLF